jgi:hypothetical protein
MMVALEPVRQKWGLDRIIVSTYQAVSGAGMGAILETQRELKEVLDDGVNPRDVKAVIAGVVRDFSVNSLEEAVTPLVITLLSESDLQKGFYLQLRLRPENREETLQQIEAVWNEMNPNQPFGYADMHRDFMARNGKVLSLSHILTFYAVIGLLLTGFGLFGNSAAQAKRL